MGTEKVSERRGDGEGNHEVGYRQEGIKTFIDPLMGFLSLTGGTVTIAAGTKQLIGFPASFALADNRSELGGSAVDNCMKNFPLLWGDVLCKCFQIRWAVCKENIR